MCYEANTELIMHSAWVYMIKAAAYSVNAIMHSYSIYCWSEGSYGMLRQLSDFYIQKRVAPL